MLTRIVKWVSIAVLLLALLWPSSTGFNMLLGLAACASAILAVQASRTGNYFRQTECTTVSRKVKYED